MDKPARPVITMMRMSTAPSKPAPKAGDRRNTRTHGLQIRVQCMARNPQTGQPIGRIVSNGKPVFDWRAPYLLEPWDYHLLTAEERAELGVAV